MGGWKDRVAHQAVRTIRDLAAGDAWFLRWEPGHRFESRRHRARCQWLIGYLVHRLGMKVDLLGPEIHTHGHFGLPAGCRMEGGVCRYGDQVVMFRHHL